MRSDANFVKRILRYPGVNARIILPFLLAIIAIAAIGVYIVTRLVAGSIQERFTNQLVASASAAANAIVDIEAEHLSTLRLMVFTDGVPQAIREGRSDDLDLWLRPVAANTFIDEILILNASGNPLLYLSRLDTPLGVEYASSPPPDITTWESLQLTLQGQRDALGDKFVDVINDAEGRTTIYFNAPVTVTDTQETTGVIVLGLRVEKMVRQIAQQSLSAVTTINQQGEVTGSTFRTDNNLLEIDQIETLRLLEEVENDSPIRSITLDGIPYQLLYAPLQIRSQSIGLLSVGLPTEYIVEQSGASRNVFGLVFAGFFVVVGALGLLIARTITNPISRLVSTTRAIRDGDLSRRVHLAPRDELGELGVSFDIMTDQLVKRNQEVTHLLDQQVEITAQREAVLTSISDAVIVQDDQGQTLLRNHTADQLIAAIANDPEQSQTFYTMTSNPQGLNHPRMVSFAGRHLSVLATPVSMTGGDLLGYVIVFRDITAIIETEKVKDELVLQMSHELRTPLGAVRGYVDLVKMMDSSKLSEQSLGFIDSAGENLSTLERMVNQVIDVSAMISNRFTIETETFNLAYILGDAFSDWQPAMKQRDLRFSLVLSTQDMFVEGDPQRLQEMIDHLLRNAHDYTLPGGMVEIDATITSQRAIISIADSGAGIYPEEIEKVFERMYRGRAADAGDTDARGMGMGLYIAKHIAQAHDGSIIAESEVGLGTIMTVSLPLRQGNLLR